MRIIYSLLFYFLLPFLPLRLLWRSRKNPAYRRRIRERFAFLGIAPLPSSIWVHAVSVGEALSAVPLITELLQRYPKDTIIVTTMTPTGADCIAKTFWGRVLQLYVPYDYPGAVKRFLRITNPRLLVIMETELWPNILHYVSKQQIPILLANARLSERSYVGYKKIAKFTQKMLAAITTVAAQSSQDAERFLALGLPAQKLQVYGNVKFDINIPLQIKNSAVLLREQLGKSRPIWVAASTHEGEEEKVLLAAKKVLVQIPDALLILVPRHPERFAAVYQLCVASGLETVCYSKQQACPLETQVLLGDVMGQMLLFYAVSDVAFVGGSLINWGGHNLLEPAALAKPVVSGQNLAAFAAISKLLTEAKALVKVGDECELAEIVSKLLHDKALREQYGNAALDVVLKHRGATDKLLIWIEEHL